MSTTCVRSFPFRLYLLLLLALSAQTAVAQSSSPDSAVRDTAQPDSTKLEVVRSEKADYPLEAREKQMQGEVVLRLHVSETGDVEDIDVLSGDPVFVQSAVSAARKWKFKPFIHDGKPIKVTAKIPFDFAFKENVRTGSDSLQKSPAPGYANIGTKSSGGAPADDQGPRRVRVSAGVTTGLLIRKVAPVYPKDARRERIEGTVILQAIIDKDGFIKDLKYVSGPKELTDSAMGAVQQWRYRPYLLMGEPVEVETMIQVNYQLH